MFAVNGKLIFFVATIMTVVTLSVAQNFGENEVPAVLSYNSPLRQPDSLKTGPYLDFLSTLYRNDREKARYYQHRVKREIANEPAGPNNRNRRAIVFRPLFVYKQQQIRRQQLQAERKRRV
ncbi:limostatin isoform X2 [Haematobia irritans]|uniref:limostatin isoform X2 n=1 Tax=Haematobia irritans TaxID=7368 RepID=UPI003F50538B